MRRREAGVADAAGDRRRPSLARVSRRRAGRRRGRAARCRRSSKCCGSSTSKEHGFEATAAIVDGVVYRRRPGRQLLRARSGRRQGEVEVSHRARAFSARPAVRDGRVFVGDTDGKFYCLDAATGKPLWGRRADGEINAGANFYKDNVLFGSQDATLYCLDAADRQAGLEVHDRRSDSLLADGRRGPRVPGRLRRQAAHHRPGQGRGDRARSRSTARPAARRRSCGDLRLFRHRGRERSSAIDWKEAKIVWTYASRSATCRIARRPP